MRRVGCFVLAPHLLQPEARGEAVGADQRCAARRQAGARVQPPRGTGRRWCRQEVGGAPDVLRAGLDAAPAFGHAQLDLGPPIGDLQWTEATFADVQRLERVLALALSALQVTGSHRNPFRSIALSLCDEPGARHTSLWNWHLPSVTRRGSRGFVGPVPPPLWMCPAMCPPVYNVVGRNDSRSVGQGG